MTREEALREAEETLKGVREFMVELETKTKEMKRLVDLHMVAGKGMPEDVEHTIRVTQELIDELAIVIKRMSDIIKDI